MPGGPPNILWIVTTQWRAQALGCAGDLNARTPQLDALAAESINFAQAVTPHPFGPFARAALLTGVPSPQNGVRDYFDPLPADARTIAHELNQRGYRTAFFGKWHLGVRAPDESLVGEAHARIVVPPLRRGGFQFWEGFESGFLLNDPWLHGSRLPEPVQFPGYQSSVVCDRAAGWFSESGVQESDGRTHRPATAPRPFFAVVSLEAPHPPYGAPAGGVPGRDPAEISLRANVPRGGGVEARARVELAGYYAHIEATDRAIGRLLERIDRSSTVVVFTSVHGDMHGAHGFFRKGWPHEESVRVPLLVRGATPQQSSRIGVSSSELVSLLDVPSWTLAWADGSQPGPGLRTRAIETPDSPIQAPALSRIHSVGSSNEPDEANQCRAGARGHASGFIRKEARRQAGSTGSRPPEAAALRSGESIRLSGSELQRLSMPSVVALPDQCDRAWRGVRTASRKLILNTDGSPWLFFDLEADPLELCNLAAAPERAAEIASWREQVRS